MSVASKVRRSAVQFAKACGLVLRFAADRDFAEIFEIAQESFPFPANWAFVRKNRALYKTDIRQKNVDGILRIVVAQHIRESFLAGYCYYQLRDGGDIYIVELAANPSKPEHKIRLTGSLLLCFALEEALAHHCQGLATLNIVAHGSNGVPNQLPDTGRGSHQFYERFGYKWLVGTMGYRMTRRKPMPNSRWMAAEIHEAANRTERYLAEKISLKSASNI